VFNHNLLRALLASGVKNILFKSCGRKADSFLKDSFATTQRVLYQPGIRSINLGFENNDLKVVEQKPIKTGQT
jgi:hypothetical protein